MTGLHARTGWAIWKVRSLIEGSVLLLGWWLGGNVGLGTLAFALLIGPLCGVTLGWFGIVAARSCRPQADNHNRPELTRMPASGRHYPPSSGQRCRRDPAALAPAAISRHASRFRTQAYRLCRQPTKAPIPICSPRWIWASPSCATAS